MTLKQQYSWPSFSTKEAKIISKVLMSNNVNYLFGKIGKEFEDKFAAFSNTKHALAMANGTLALDASLRSIKLSPGDEVLVTSRSFIASASSIALLGAVPVWCDVDINSQNIDINEIEKKYTKKTKAILCVHFAGFPCDMEQIMSFAKSKNIFVIEDCAQAHGASLNKKSVGSFGDISAWSFCNDKIMSLGGEGGMITSNSKPLYDFVSSFNNHGKNLIKYFSQKEHTRFPYFHDNLGSNYRLTEMQSALGIYQLSKMKSWHELRKRNAEIYINSVIDIDIVNTPLVPTNAQHAWYKLYAYVQINALANNWSRDRIVGEINQLGVPCYSGSCSEIYLEKAFDQKFRPNERLENARLLGETSLAFLVHPTLSSGDLEKTCSVLETILNLASKSI